MPLTPIEKKSYLQSQGLNPDEYDIDDASATVVKKKTLQPNVSPSAISPISKQQQNTTSVLGAAGANFGAGIFPTATGLMGAVPGAKLGAGIGSLVGPVGTAVFGTLGGIAGAIAGSYGGAKLQESVLPDVANEYLQRANLEHPIASTVGNVAAALPLGLRPDKTLLLKDLPAALRKIPAGTILSPIDKQALMATGVGAGLGVGNVAYDVSQSGRELGLQDVIGIAGNILLNNAKPGSFAASKYAGSQLDNDTLRRLSKLKTGAQGTLVDPMGDDRTATPVRPTPVDPVAPVAPVRQPEAEVQMTLPILENIMAPKEGATVVVDPAATATKAEADPAVTAAKAEVDLAATAAKAEADTRNKQLVELADINVENARMEAELNAPPSAKPAPVSKPAPIETPIIEQGRQQTESALGELTPEQLDARAKANAELETKHPKAAALERNLDRIHGPGKWSLNQAYFTAAELYAKARNIVLKHDPTTTSEFKDGVATVGSNANVDTAIHEPNHGIWDWLAQSNSKVDNKLAQGAHDKAAASPEFAAWYKTTSESRRAGMAKPYEVGSVKADGAVHEFLTEMSAYDVLNTERAISGESEWTQYKNDVFAHLKTRFTKGATLKDFQRHFANRARFDAPYAPVDAQAKGVVGADVNEESPRLQPESALPAIQDEILGKGAKMVSAKMPFLTEQGYALPFNAALSDSSKFSIRAAAKSDGYIVDFIENKAYVYDKADNPIKISESKDSTKNALLEAYASKQAARQQPESALPTGKDDSFLDASGNKVINNEENVAKVRAKMLTVDYFNDQELRVLRDEERTKIINNFGEDAFGHITKDKAVQAKMASDFYDDSGSAKFYGNEIGHARTLADHAVERMGEKYVQKFFDDVDGVQRRFGLQNERNQPESALPGRKEPLLLTERATDVSTKNQSDDIFYAKYPRLKDVNKNRWTDAALAEYTGKNISSVNRQRNKGTDLNKYADEQTRTYPRMLMDETGTRSAAKYEEGDNIYAPRHQRVKYSELTPADNIDIEAGVNNARARADLWRTGDAHDNFVQFLKIDGADYKKELLSNALLMIDKEGLTPGLSRSKSMFQSAGDFAARKIQQDFKQKLERFKAENPDYVPGTKSAEPIVAEAKVEQAKPTVVKPAIAQAKPIDVSGLVDTMMAKAKAAPASATDMTAIKMLEELQTAKRIDKNGKMTDDFLESLTERYDGPDEAKEVGISWQKLTDELKMLAGQPAKAINVPALLKKYDVDFKLPSSSGEAGKSVDRRGADIGTREDRMGRGQDESALPTTPQFKEWFGESKVVDDEGEPLVVYHGTAGDFSVFDRSKASSSFMHATAYLGDFFSASPEVANLFVPTRVDQQEWPPKMVTRDGGHIKAVFIRIVRPYDISLAEFRAMVPHGRSEKGVADAKRLQRQIKDGGYDGIRIKGDLALADSYSASEWAADTYITFDSNQIKSATGNDGNDSRLDNDIRRQDESALSESNPDNDPHKAIASNTNVKYLEAAVDEVRRNHGANIGEHVAQSFTDTLRQKDSLYGQFVNPMVKTVNDLLGGFFSNPVDNVKGFNDSTKKVLNALYWERDNSAPASHILLNAEEKAAIVSLRATLKAMHVEQRANGPLVAERVGDKVVYRQAQDDPYYFPHKIDMSVLEIIMNKPGSVAAQKLRDDFLQYRIAMGQSMDEAKDSLIRLQPNKSGASAIPDYNAVRYEEGYGLPPEWREKDLLRIVRGYGNAWSTDMAFFQNVQSKATMRRLLDIKDDGMGNVGAKTQATELNGENIEGVNLNSAPDVQSIMRGLSHGYTPTDIHTTAWNRLVKAGMMQTFTGLADATAALPVSMQYVRPSELLLLPQALLELKRGYRVGLENGTIKHGTTSIQDALGLDSGTTNVLDTLTHVLNKVSGREALEQLSRAQVNSLGYLIAESRYAGALAGKAKDVKYFDSIDPKWKSIKDQDKLFVKAAARLTDMSQGTYDARGLPRTALEGSLSPFLSLAKWNIEQFNNWNKNVIGALKEGNATPLLMSTLGAIVGGAAVEELRKAIYKRKPNQLTNEEWWNTKEDTAYKLMALSSLGGYAGIMTEMGKLSMDVARGNSPQGFTFPIAEVIMNNTDRVGQFMAALEDGTNPSEALVAFAQTMLTDHLQLARIAQRAMEDPAETKRKDTMRDARLQKQVVEGQRLPKAMGRDNPMMGQDSKTFKRTGSVEEAASLLPKLLEDAIKRSGNDPEKMKKEFSKLKSNSLQSFANPENEPLLFGRQYEWLKRSQGDTAANLAVAEFFRQRAVNRYKSSMVPTL